MSGHNYITNPNNLFEDDDVDDETFLKNSRVNSPGQQDGGVNSTNPFEVERQRLQERRKQIESSTLESSKRSLGLLHETEEVGQATAIELTKQREQLEKSSRQLDEISATLRFSQKHLNGLKSVFGGLKNYLAGNKGMPPPPSSSQSSTSSASNLKDKINNVGQENGYQSPTAMSPDERYSSHPMSRIRDDQNDQQQQQQERGTFDERLEQNLDEMCSSLSRLKGLAIDLKSEIDTQNDLIDNMNYKVEDVDLKIGKQNKEMNKLLGKK